MSMTISIRIGAVRGGGYKGQRSHDLRHGKVPSYVDQARSGLNFGDNVPTLARVHQANEDQKHGARVAAQALYEAAVASGDENRIKAAKAAKQACRQRYDENGVVAYRGILTFGRDAQSVIRSLPREELEDLVRSSVAGAADVVKTAAFGLSVHMDETAPHAHFYWLATNEQGKKVNPGKGDCRQIQTEAAKPFARLGIKRGKSRELWIEEGADQSKYINQSVKQLHEKLPKEIANAQAELKAILEEKMNIEANLQKVQIALDEANRNIERLTKEIERLKLVEQAFNKSATRTQEDSINKQRYLEQLNKDIKSSEQRLDFLQGTISQIEYEYNTRQANGNGTQSKVEKAFELYYSPRSVENDAEYKKLFESMNEAEQLKLYDKIQAKDNAETIDALTEIENDFKMR